MSNKFKKIGRAMKLSETVKEILKKMTQKKLGIALGMPADSAQQNVSNMKRAADDSDLELHWQQSLKLLNICKQHGIDPTAQELINKPTSQISGGTHVDRSELSANLISAFQKVKPRTKKSGKKRT
jgi:hypothetical protein